MQGFLSAFSSVSVNLLVFLTPEHINIAEDIMNTSNTNSAIDGVVPIAVGGKPGVLRYLKGLFSLLYLDPATNVWGEIRSHGPTKVHETTTATEAVMHLLGVKGGEPSLAPRARLSDAVLDRPGQAMGLAAQRHEGRAMAADELRRIVLQKLPPLGLFVANGHYQFTSYMWKLNAAATAGLLKRAMQKRPISHLADAKFGAPGSRVLRTILEVAPERSSFSNYLRAAAYLGREDIVRLLLEKGAYHDAALHDACFSGHHEVVQIFLRHRVDVDTRGGAYGNALQAACSRGHYHIAKTLLNAGADVNRAGGFYYNALNSACFIGSEETVRLLLQHGALVNAQDDRYGNALQAASSRGQHGIIKILLQHGANANAKGGHYGNALRAAISERHTAVAWILRLNGAAVNA